MEIIGRGGGTDNFRGRRWEPPIILEWGRYTPCSGRGGGGGGEGADNFREGRWDGAPNNFRGGDIPFAPEGGPGAGGRGGGPIIFERGDGGPQ